LEVKPGEEAGWRGRERRQQTDKILRRKSRTKMRKKMRLENSRVCEEVT